jgi:hypothetical protein
LGQFGFIEPDRDQPRVVRGTQPQLLDGQQEFLVLVTSAAAQALLGEAGKEYQGVVGDRAPDVRAPVLTRPQVGGIPPCDHQRQANSATARSAGHSVDGFAGEAGEIPPPADHSLRRNALAIGAETPTPRPPPSTSTAKAKSPPYQ